MTSVSGGFGFTCGVEWLATEKIEVHGCTGLSWGNADNLVEQLARLNQLLADHPCFFDGAKLIRASPTGADVFALRRDAAGRSQSVLSLINTDPDKPHAVDLEAPFLAGFLTENQGSLSKTLADLLGSKPPVFESLPSGKWRVTLAPGASHCLTVENPPAKGAGETYRRRRAQAAWALGALARILDPEEIGPFDWRALGEFASDDPAGFLTLLTELDRALARTDLLAALNMAKSVPRYPPVIVWTPADARRVTPVPDKHWLLIVSPDPFRAFLRPGATTPRCAESIPSRDAFIAAFPPDSKAGRAELEVELWRKPVSRVTASLQFLSERWTAGAADGGSFRGPPEAALVLLTNGRGGMSRLCVDVGRITSKYDCLVGANLHPSVPVDRHVFAKRVRIWAMANGFLSPLNGETLTRFEADPVARWLFTVPTGDGHTVPIGMTAAMVPGENTTQIQFEREPGPTEADAVEVRLTIRVDLEDRNFHWETKRNPGAEAHFESHVRVLPNQAGFDFDPAEDRHLRVTTSAGVFHRNPEWSENIPHPVEATRGMTGSGDAYSPGWFDFPLPAGHKVILAAECDPKPEPAPDFPAVALRPPTQAGTIADSEEETFSKQMRQAIQSFVVRRDAGKTVIAGYPWFLDWGRDTLICARGMLSAGMVDEVEQILRTFGRFEEEGTLPNTIHGEDASNRETSDAPLWFGLVCEEWSTRGYDAAAPLSSPGVERAPEALRALYHRPIDAKGRTLFDVLRSIATHYAKGTSTGIGMDPGSGLIWSPAHFTWMDTNHPACTPREGYPIEIQVLWIRLLRQLARIDSGPEAQSWTDLAHHAEESLHRFYWLDAQGWWADVLHAGKGVPAHLAAIDDALRSNGLLAVSLEAVKGERAQRSVEAARRHLVIPGAVRSLAPLPVKRPLEIRGGDGRLLNQPQEPYWGRYEGDEDTRRKPAYHNGTAWVWVLPVFAEALFRAWDKSPASRAAAKGYLLSLQPLLEDGCIGQLPEILDGDSPHLPRGCDAQAWSATEALRVWQILTEKV